MTRRFFSAFLPLLAILLLSVPAQAGLGWCRSDPILTLDGKQVQVLVYIPGEYEPLVDNPTRVEIKTPQQVSRKLIMTDAGLNNKGYDVSFSDIGDSEARMTSTSYRIWVHVKPPIKTSDIVPVMVEVVLPDGSVQTLMGNNSVATEGYLTIRR